MKRLALIRHAKASRAYPLVGDFDRPLDPRGRGDLSSMAQRFASAAHPPWRLVSSPALRAVATAQGFADALEIPHDRIRGEPLVYEATPDTLLHVVNNLDDADGQVALFGHNPGFTELAQLLAPVPFAEMPTCAVVTIEFGHSRWREIIPGSGHLTAFMVPKDES